MADFLKGVFFFFIVLFLIELYKDGKKKERVKIIPPPPVDTISYQDSQQDIEATKPETSTEQTNSEITLVPLGYVNQSLLIFASKSIKEFWGITPDIGEQYSIDNDILIGGDTLDAWKCISNLPSKNKTIYLTTNPLYSNGVKLRGYTTIWGKVLIVRADSSFLKETLTHEIGHTLGLDHCQDLYCIMAINNDEYDMGDFCKDCKSKINR